MALQVGLIHLKIVFMAYKGTKHPSHREAKMEISRSIE